MSLVQQYHQKSKAFHAEIARRAALVAAKSDNSYSIPNVPFGMKKHAPPPPRVVAIPPRNPEPDFWPEMWFYDLVFGDGPKPLKVEDVYRATAKEFGVTKLDLISQRRTADVVLPRQVGFYLAKMLTGRSLPELARRMGGRDHTTALHGIRKIERLVATDSELAARIEKIKASL